MVAIEKFARRIYLIDEKQVKILLLHILCTESGVMDEDQREADTLFFLTCNVVKRIVCSIEQENKNMLFCSLVKIGSSPPSVNTANNVTSLSSLS
jgi:hypothetical protein